jgi:hypothetical protein
MSSGGKRGRAEYEATSTTPPLAFDHRQLSEADIPLPADIHPKDAYILRVQIAYAVQQTLLGEQTARSSADEDARRALSPESYKRMGHYDVTPVTPPPTAKGEAALLRYSHFLVSVSYPVDAKLDHDAIQRIKEFGDGWTVKLNSGPVIRAGISRHVLSWTHNTVLAPKPGVAIEVATVFVTKVVVSTLDELHAITDAMERRSGTD